MLHMILLILKIIGILLLVILGILVFLLLCLLFVPFRYDAKTEGKNTDWDLRGGVSWLFYLVSVKACYIEKQFSYEVYLFGIPVLKLLSKFKKRTKSNRGEKADEPEKITVTKEEKPEEIPVSKEHKPEKEDSDGKELPQEEDRKPLPEAPEIPAAPGTDQKGAEKDAGASEEEPSILERILSVLQSVIRIPSKICCAIRKGYAKIQSWKELLHSEEVTHLKKTAVLYLKKIWNHSKPRMVEGSILFGFDDPALTGELLGGISVFYALLPRRLVITPDFQEQRIEGQLHVAGRIYGICFLTWVLQILFDKKTIPAVKHLMNKEDK